MSVSVQVSIPQQVVQQLLQSGFSIATAFPPSQSQMPPVLWNATQPGPAMTYQWQNQFGLYASQTRLQAGARINIVSQLNSVQSGQLYPFQADGAFGGPTGGAPNNTVGVINQMTQTMTFGLIQQAVINGQMQGPGPVSASSVPTGMTFPIPELATIGFFITQTNQAGVVLASIPQPSILIDTATSPQINLSFDGQGWSQN